MLPIDENAKSGAWIFAHCCIDTHEEVDLTKVRWDGAALRWREPSGFVWAEDLFTHYLPASWVENAGAMREALKRSELDAKTFASLANVWHENTDAEKVLTATEWPPKP